MSAEPNELSEQIKSLAADYERIYRVGYEVGYKAGVRDTAGKALEMVNKAFPSKVQA